MAKVISWSKVVSSGRAHIRGLYARRHGRLYVWVQHPLYANLDTITMVPRVVDEMLVYHGRNMVGEYQRRVRAMLGLEA
jgi:hypothetical protein